MNNDKVQKIRRRALSISIIFLLAVSLIVLSPILLSIGLLMSVITRYSSFINALLFLYGYVFFEMIGVIALALSWLRDRGTENFLENTRKIQTWWSSGLLNLGCRIYKLNFQVTGSQQIEGPSAILMPRHTSIGDTVLPIIFFAHKRNEGLRYILKKELLILPCLDIAGNRLPNLFVDRSGQDTKRELLLIEDLLNTTNIKESILIYPEGTRSSSKKRKSIAQKHPEMADLLDRWPDLLPPRKGGPLTILNTNTEKDIVFLAHVGFEGSASLIDLINGSWMNQRIHLHFWRIPFSEIPEDKEKFLFDQWDNMQNQIEKLKSFN